MENGKVQVRAGLYWTSVGLGTYSLTQTRMHTFPKEIQRESMRARRKPEREEVGTSDKSAP